MDENDIGRMTPRARAQWFAKASDESIGFALKTIARLLADVCGFEPDMAVILILKEAGERLTRK